MLDTGHSYDTINKTLDILRTEEKVQLLNILERFYIYDLSRQGLQMNDTYSEKHNPIFELIINKHNYHSNLPPPLSLPTWVAHIYTPSSSHSPPH
jgi:hypothetical protein